VRTNELEGRALDYWCARALVDDDEEVIFVEVEPRVVVTLTHGTLRKLAQPFSPSDEWGDAVVALELADELQWVRSEQGVHCRARFGEGVPTEADGEHPRIALLRAFVQARFGESVEAPPGRPHAVRQGKVRPYDAGGVPPTYGESAGADNEIGDIRTVPRQ
jgi:hypothetical protein